MQAWRVIPQARWKVTLECSDGLRLSSGQREDLQSHEMVGGFVFGSACDGGELTTALVSVVESPTRI
jgi:hypothetical protein